MSTSIRSLPLGRLHVLLLDQLGALERYGPALGARARQRDAAAAAASARSRRPFGAFGACGAMGIRCVDHAEVRELAVLCAKLKVPPAPDAARRNAVRATGQR